MRKTFQELILKLSEFWAREGCVLQQPLDLEVGAGTMHPEVVNLNFEGKTPR